MTRLSDILVTAAAPAIWGSSYIVTTEFLPDGYPITSAMLRALPAGLLLLACVRHLPQVSQLGRIVILGALNFAIFWSLLFVAAYRLPGGLAATVGALQPLFVIFLANAVLGTPVFRLSVVAAVAGAGGVSLLVLSNDTTLDALGLVAALGGALSMAAGTVLSRKWQHDVSPLTFAAWQLTAGGILLLPIALVFEPSLPALTTRHLTGYAYLSLIGGALTYVLWFRGIARLAPAAVSALGFLSPVAALVLGWALLGQHLNFVQAVGIAVVLGSIWLSQIAYRTPTPTPKTRPKMRAPVQ